jgi:hypothetical protein
LSERTRRCERRSLPSSVQPTVQPRRWTTADPCAGRRPAYTVRTAASCGPPQTCKRLVTASRPRLLRARSSGRRRFAVQLAAVTRSQRRPLQSTRTGRSAARSGVAALFPKLIVRVRFSSPAPPRKACHKRDHDSALRSRVAPGTSLSLAPSLPEPEPARLALGLAGARRARRAIKAAPLRGAAGLAAPLGADPGQSRAAAREAAWPTDCRNRLGHRPRKPRRSSPRRSSTSTASGR